ncbi:MAG TPA: M3 family oligoendopeptidase [Candidatus Nanoarchaeia archaeon]|nr:M3 family oligoendopeptidase [Candidatus Nanoarchaeia archaeon]
MNYNSNCWDLDKIKPKSLDHELKEIELKTSKLEQKRTQLKSSIFPTNFLKLLQEFEQLKIQIGKVGVYTHLKFCENTLNQKAVAEMSLVENFLTRITNRLLFFSIWFKSLPAAKVNELIAQSGKYSYFLEVFKKNKPYTLKENEEKIINLKEITGVSALNNIYNLLTSQFEFTFQGKKRTQEEMVTYVRSSFAAVREEAYQTLFRPFVKNKQVLGEVYKNIVNDWKIENVDLRGYKNPLNVRNTANDLPDKAVEVLLKVCKKNQALFHRFFEIKRKKMGLKKMRRYDIYAPLKEEKEHIAYDKAVRMVLDTLENFSPELKKLAELIIQSNHVHSTVQAGKVSGAFCCSAGAKITPYVLLSYTGKYRDVSTLAHELGHGIHYLLSSVQTEFTNSACLPLAETASIFSEMLLSEKILQQNPKAAESIIFTKLDDLYASIIRQAGFVEFEIKAHQMLQEGKTVDEISAVYLADLRSQLGPKVEVNEIFANEWTYIPHIFHTPFYCYAYAFGNLLTLALYEVYKEQGNKFVPKFIKLLSLGGSASPVEITKLVGVDIASEKFWQKGFDVIERMIKEIT